VFGAAIFLGAVLLFLLEPMLAKMLLPRFGGAPAVWTTCVVFFQMLLLAGYAYAHLTTTQLRSRHQVMLHLTLLVVCLAFLPIGIPDLLVPASPDRPAVALLGILTLVAGLPFFMVSSTTPLLQRWFASTGYLDSHDPYYYYAASNAGSLLALLAYPVLVEPFFSLPVQSSVWAVGFCLWLLSLVACSREIWRSDSAYSKSQTRTPKSRAADSELERRISYLSRARWVVLAFVPSSLMLGCTNYLTADVASVPLLWIVPLALYLLSFIFAFARGTPPWVHRAMVLAFPVALCLQLTDNGTDLGTMVIRHLTTLFVAAMVCHGELARSRPPATRLTEYYLWIAVGGALGSCFNALVAPFLFSWVVEYPFALALAALLLPPLFPTTRRRILRIGNRVIPIALACLVGAVFLSNHHQFLQDWRVVHEERNFFGVYRVASRADEKTYGLLHGHVWHGLQIDGGDPRQRRVPLLYYFPSGPVGQIFSAFTERKANPTSPSSD
jgi:hypothetical protein